MKPVRVIASAERRSKMDLDLIILAFDYGHIAEEALQAVELLAREKTISVVDAAVLFQDHEGKVVVSETQDADAKQGALFGAVAGGLIGMAGGLATALLGSLAGAGIGGLVAHGLDMGFAKEDLREMQDALQPGGSALVVVVERRWADRLIEGLARFQGRVSRRELGEIRDGDPAS
jgi:uncharacterized membrane protein